MATPVSINVPRPRGDTAENSSPQATTAPQASASAASAPPSSRVPHIRIVPHLDGHRSLRFDVIDREVPSGTIIKIGRFTDKSATTNRISFRSKVVSRGHAEIWTENDQFFIRDTQSSSGTFLNHVRLSAPGQESRQHELRDGDVLQLGVDYQGGTEEIYRCVKMRVELNRSWQWQMNPHRLNTFHNLRTLVSPTSGSPIAAMAAAQQQNQDTLTKLADSDNKSITSRASWTQPKSTDAIEECAICLYAIAPFQALFISPCSHSYHYKCIRPLLANHPSFLCPICRTYADLDASVAIEANEVMALYGVQASKQTAIEEKSAAAPAASHDDSNLVSTANPASEAIVMMQASTVSAGPRAEGYNPPSDVRSPVTQTTHLSDLSANHSAASQDASTSAVIPEIPGGDTQVANREPKDKSVRGSDDIFSSSTPRTRESLLSSSLNRGTAETNHEDDASPPLSPLSDGDLPNLERQRTLTLPNQPTLVQFLHDSSSSFSPSAFPNYSPGAASGEAPEAREYFTAAAPPRASSPRSQQGNLRNPSSPRSRSIMHQRTTSQGGIVDKLRTTISNIGRPSALRSPSAGGNANVRFGPVSISTGDGGSAFDTAASEQTPSTSVNPLSAGETEREERRFEDDTNTGTPIDIQTSGPSDDCDRSQDTQETEAASSSASPAAHVHDEVRLLRKNFAAMSSVDDAEDASRAAQTT